MSKAIAIGYLMKVSVGNLNASHSEGNVIVTKKITLPDGSSLPYISGQAIRRMLRDRLEGLGWRLSEPFSSVAGQEVTPPVRPWDFIDEDLFGYLDPSGARRRTSPVRVSAAIGLFPFQGDRDLGTRSFEKFGKGMESGGNMFETEVYYNLFRGNLLIELDRVGVFWDQEIGEAKDLPEELTITEEIVGKHQRRKVALPPNERIRRLANLLDALNILWGGGRTARMLADLSPKFLAYTRLKVKHPVFLEALEANFEEGAYRLLLSPLLNALHKFRDQKEEAIFGVEPGFLLNEEEVRRALSNYGEVHTVPDAIRKAKEDLGKIWNS